jgi:hypothetical protein
MTRFCNPANTAPFRRHYHRSDRAVHPLISAQFLVQKSEATSKYLIIDRDTKYTEQFRRMIRDEGTKVIRLPPRSPNLNKYAERFVRSITDECLDRMIFVGQGSLWRAVAEYLSHYKYVSLCSSRYVVDRLRVPC